MTQKIKYLVPKSPQESPEQDLRLVWHGDEGREHEHCNIEVHFNPGTPQRYKECKWSPVVDTLKAGAILASLGIVTSIRFAQSSFQYFGLARGLQGKVIAALKPMSAWPLEEIKAEGSSRVCP